MQQGQFLELLERDPTRFTADGQSGYEPLGTDPDRLWRRLSAVWCELVQTGCDPVLLRTQALITPACGLAGHGVSQAARALKLASTIATRVTDQAVAARLSAGA